MGLDSHVPVGAVALPSLVICNIYRRVLARSAIMFDDVADGTGAVSRCCAVAGTDSRPSPPCCCALAEEDSHLSPPLPTPRGGLLKTFPPTKVLYWFS